jgi:hypothetical protein
MSEKIIAFCGINCSGCPALIATQQNDLEAKKQLAQTWSTEKYQLKPEEMVCDGCLALDERLVKFCLDCTTRQCARAKAVENCAYCDEFPCDKLMKHWENPYMTEARGTLAAIHRELAGSIS